MPYFSAWSLISCASASDTSQRPARISFVYRLSGGVVRLGGGSSDGTDHASSVITAMRSTTSSRRMFHTMLSVAIDSGPS